MAIGKVWLPLPMVVLILVSISLGDGCARVPPQAVVLSQTVGRRLTDLQTSHEAFVRAYFQATRDRIEDYLTNQWTPTFLANFIDTSDFMTKLENVQPLTAAQKTKLGSDLLAAGISPADQTKVIQAVGSALGSTDRAKLALNFSEAALNQIQLKKKSLLGPIDELERQTLTELAGAYSQIEEAQNTVTAHLSSISKVTEEQDKVLKELGLLEKRDAIIDKAVNANQTAMDILSNGKEAEKTLTDLEEHFKSLKKP